MPKISRTLSVIVPAFNEEENILLVYRRLADLSVSSDYSFEFVFVDDGSTDGTFSILKTLSAEDRRVKVLRFSRNFGSHAACAAGLAHASGDASAFISADLQDPPEVVLRLAAQWEQGFDVVMGAREWEGNSLRVLPKLYWRLVKRFALRNMPENGFDVFLVDRKVAAAVSEIGEKNTSVFALILWSGFQQTLITYRKMARHRGISKWTFGKKLKLFIDTFVSFSFFPIRMISFVGVLFALIGFLYAVIVVFNRIFLAVPIEGWTSLMVVLLVVSGIQLTMLGVLGEYLWRNFDESRKRPLFIIRDRIGLTTPGNGA
ncbi:MAG: glycosyltransferase family 2 protein [Nitrospiraceae bacterium]|nr:glycosyltransferase family 2 protein [Nitrospiraceae bacterium]